MTCGRACTKVEGPDGIYVGCSTHCKKRWTAHRSRALHDPRPSNLQKAIRRHGKDAFTFRVVLTARTTEDALECEKTIIAQHRSGGRTLYNLSDGGPGGTGWHPNSEQRKRLSEASKGRKASANAIRSTIERNKSRVWTAEARAKISAKNKGSKRTPAQLERMRLAGLGRKLSPEHVAKVVAFHKGRKRTGVALENIREGNRRYWDAYRTSRLTNTCEAPAKPERPHQE